MALFEPVPNKTPRRAFAFVAVAEVPTKGTVSAVRPLHPAKAPAATDVTDAGTDTDVKPVQFSKA